MKLACPKLRKQKPHFFLASADAADSESVPLAGVADHRCRLRATALPRTTAADYDPVAVVGFWGCRALTVLYIQLSPGPFLVLV